MKRMEFKESYALIKRKFLGMDFTKVNSDFSAIFCITGKNAGYVYGAYIGGKKIIEPVKHDSANIFVTMSDVTFEDIVNKRLEPFKAFTTGKIKAKGNVFLALSIYKKLKKK